MLRVGEFIDCWDALGERVLGFDSTSGLGILGMVELLSESIERLST